MIDDPLARDAQPATAEAAACRREVPCAEAA
jgi:hypothetical protein